MENGYTIIHKTYRLVQEMAFLATIYPPNAHSSSLTILQGGFSLVPLLKVAQSRPEGPRWLSPFCPRARTRHSGGTPGRTQPLHAHAARQCALSRAHGAQLQNQCGAAGQSSGAAECTSGAVPALGSAPSAGTGSTAPRGTWGRRGAENQLLAGAGPDLHTQTERPASPVSRCSA